LSQGGTLVELPRFTGESWDIILLKWMFIDEWLRGALALASGFRLAAKVFVTLQQSCVTGLIIR